MPTLLIVEDYESTRALLSEIAKARALSEGIALEVIATDSLEGAEELRVRADAILSDAHFYTERPQQGNIYKSEENWRFLANYARERKIPFALYTGSFPAYRRAQSNFFRAFYKPDQFMQAIDYLLREMVKPRVRLEERTDDRRTGEGDGLGKAD